MVIECQRENCHNVISTDQTFCSQRCYAEWSETEAVLVWDKRQPTKPEICKVNSLLGSVNSEFN